MSDNDKQSFKSPRFVLALVGLILLAGIITLAILRDRIVNQQFRQVTVVGQGKVTYNPDLALVTLGVQIDKIAKPEEALNQLNTKVESIIKAIKALGIAPENIQTQNYSLYPQYDYKDNITTVSGYSANQQLVVKITNYDKDSGLLSRVIASASKAGANQINSVTFDASNMNDLKQQARVKAIEDARAKSQDLAGAAGVKLGKISNWYENFISPIMNSDYGKGGMGGGAVSATPQIPAGSRDIILEIGVTYLLK